MVKKKPRNSTIQRLMLLTAIGWFGGDAVSADQIDFVRDIQPIFRRHCFACHAPGNEEGELNLAVRDRALNRTDSDALLVPGQSEHSLLLQRVTEPDTDRRMPPDGPPLETADVELIRRWIDQGAVWPEDSDVLNPRLDKARHHWAFQPLTRPAIPNPDADWIQTPVDAFILDKLRQSGIAPSSPLTARQLVRRLYYNVIGLPPDPAAITQFESKYDTNRKEATDKLIESLLGSDHYGERWARHWLDVVRYADSDGQEADRDRPDAWHYRDFVIRAFNDEQPFDQFVKWQIAGDEYEPRNTAAVVATGFLTAGPNTVLQDTFLEEERLRNRYNELDDIVSTLGSSMLGLTIGCARCHDHKFDAISAREYYQLVAAFHSGDRHAEKLPNGTKGLFFKDFDNKPRTTWLFERGDFYDRDEEVTLQFPTILTRTDAPDWQQLKPKLSGNSTGQRRALADWITDVDHGAGALLARVMVNRIWQHHFGEGLVRTVSDFGVRGEAPTHPKLLDWLATEFIRNNWNLKHIHRLILNSAAWQQGTAHRDVPSDTQNRLLWRMVPQRLEAEVLRDAMLQVSGQLNLTPYGPGFKPFIPGEAIVARNLKDGGYPADAKDDQSTRRRSIYMFHKRVVPYPLFQAFNRPDLLQSCARRENTTVAPQALALLNDSFVRAIAGAFAERLISEQPDPRDHRPRVERAFHLALSRAPSGSELDAAASFILHQSADRRQRGESAAERAALADFCQVIFGLNEFIYVD